MRKIVISILILAACYSARAQYPGYTPLTDPLKFKAEFSAATKKTSSIKSEFVQEKELSMLSEKITSRGKFWFKRESQVRMEYTQPFQYLMILNNDKIFVKDGQKENKISASSNKIFRQVNKIMIDCMQGTMFENTDFKTRIFENKGSALIELSPLTKGLKDLFKNIIVTVDKKDNLVVTMQMQEISGDNTLIRFTNKELNANIPDALFTIK